MPYQIDYCIDKRVVRVKFEGDLTQEDGRLANLAAIELIHSGVAPVHYIGDATQLKNIKINLTQVRELASFLNEPQLGWLVIIGGSPVARFLSSVIMQLRKTNFRYADSMEDAIAILGRVDLTLKQPT